MKGVVVIEYEIDEDSPTNPLEDVIFAARSHMHGSGGAEPVGLHIAIKDDAERVLDAFR